MTRWRRNPDHRLNEVEWLTLAALIVAALAVILTR